MISETWDVSTPTPIGIGEGSPLGVNSPHTSGLTCGWQLPESSGQRAAGVKCQLGVGLGGAEVLRVPTLSTTGPTRTPPPRRSHHEQKPGHPPRWVPGSRHVAPPRPFHFPRCKGKGPRSSHWSNVQRCRDELPAARSESRLSPLQHEKEENVGSEAAPYAYTWLL